MTHDSRDVRDRDLEQRVRRLLRALPREPLCAACLALACGTSLNTMRQQSRRCVQVAAARCPPFFTVGCERLEAIRRMPGCATRDWRQKRSPRHRGRAYGPVAGRGIFLGVTAEACGTSPLNRSPTVLSTGLPERYD